jgi:hypothetical protein
MLAILYSAWKIDSATRLAIPISGRPMAYSYRYLLSHYFGVASALLVLFSISHDAAASSSFSDRAKIAYSTNRMRFDAEVTNAVVAWEFGRACFDWADYVADDREREKIAREGIDACRRAIALHASLAPAHYYLGMNLGQLARTKSVGALKLVDEMEREFKRAVELDARFDYAGPHRSLGLLYLQAPGWPLSVGNRGKARSHLDRAVELCPEFPENHLCRLEAFLKWNDKKSAMAEAKSLNDVLIKARSLFHDDAWAATWLDWERRWEAAQKALKEKVGSKKH